MRNVAVLILYNEKKQILLQHRAKDAERLPDYWAFFGGGLEEGETPEQTLVREIFEELEYRVKNPVRIFDQRFGVKDDTMKYVFVESYDVSQQLVQHEGQDMRWFTFDELDTLLIVDHDKIALKKIHDYLTGTHTV